MSYPAAPNENEMIDLRTIVRVVYRRHRLIAMIVGAMLGLAVLYLLVTPSRYTAVTKVLLDPEQAGIVADISSLKKVSADSSNVDSQVEILLSRKVAISVMKSLNDPRYIQAVMDQNYQAQEQMFADLQKGLKVAREGETYVLNVEYTTNDAKRAASIANAYANAYVKSQLEAQRNASLSGAKWLEQRIKELRRKSRDADKAVQDFRVKNNIFSTNGRLINEDQVAKINSELGFARAQTATAKARYEYSKEVVDSKNIDAAVAEALDNDVINGVRAKYLTSKKRLYELVRTLGESHNAVKNMRREIMDYEDLIFREMERIAQSQLSDYKISQAREITLEKSLDGLIGVKASDDNLQVQLSKLEQEAETFQNLHKEYNKKYEMLIQQESFSLANTRVISEATPPLSRSHPRVTLILAVALVLGGGLSFLTVLLLEATDRSMRTAEQVKKYLGMPLLGLFPRESSPRQTPHMFDLKEESFTFLDPRKTLAVDHPLSVFAETIRKTRVYADRRSSKRDCRVIGVISCYPDEGKSTISANLAGFIASTGSSCLMIDMDVRNPSYTQEDFVHPIHGLGDIFAQTVTIQDALIREEKTNLAILPAVGKSTEDLLRHINEAEVGILFDMYAKSFDYIILDLPPLSATSDVESVSAHIDSYVLVTQWGKTSWEAVQTYLSDYQIAEKSVLGVVLNKANMEDMIRYYGYALYPRYTRYAPQMSALKPKEPKVVEQEPSATETVQEVVTSEEIAVAEAPTSKTPSKKHKKEA
jgi:polysaccharide biosynthesis transport protein